MSPPVLPALPDPLWSRRRWLAWGAGLTGAGLWADVGAAPAATVDPGTAGASAPATAPAAAPAAATPPSRSGAWRLLQPLDPAAEQQEHVRDYAAGLQLAVRVRRRDAPPGPEIQVQQLVCDGSVAAVQALARRFADDPGLLGIAGATTERCSQACLTHWPSAQPLVPQIAPWLFDERHDRLGHVLTVFASRQQQVRQTLRTLSAMGMSSLGVVYASAAEELAQREAIDRTVGELRWAVPAWTAAGPDGIEQLAARLPADAPAVLAFAGGAIELGRFMLALLTRLPPGASRPSLLDEVSRRPAVDVDGYALRFTPDSNRGSRLVLQTLLNREGQLVG